MSLTLDHTTPHEFTTTEDISSVAFWHKTFEERDETFARLRKDNPVSWHPPLETPDMAHEVHQETGFWAVTRLEDVKYISENNELFISGSPRGVILRPRPINYSSPPAFIEMDPPFHTRYRQLMSRAFTPKAVAALSAKIAERATAIVDRVVGAGEFDFVKEVSAKLPMLTVADMIGVPESEIETFAEAGDQLVTGRDPDVRPPGMSMEQFQLEAVMTLWRIGVDLVHYRRNHPANDIATALANAEFDGKPLADNEIASLMSVLSVAGNDTTKQTTSIATIQLDLHPEQKAWLSQDFDGRIAGSIEEFIRYASPVMEFTRTVTEDIELRGQRLSARDAVAIFYSSANRDESEFPDPHKFDLQRARNPHVGFGGGGIHYCLGNGVAKAQLRALFGQILTKLPNIEVGEPEYLHNEWINGVSRLPVNVH